MQRGEMVQNQMILPCHPQPVRNLLVERWSHHASLDLRAIQDHVPGLSELLRSAQRPTSLGFGVFQEPFDYFETTEI